MSYIGIHPQLRAYHSSVYVANEGETKLPLRKDVEAVLVKNGVILIPDTDYYPDAKNDLVLTAPAKAGDEFFLLNLSTFTFSDTVSRSELEKELELRQDPMFSVIWLPSRNVIPAGYVPADGQLEQRSMYPSAWEAIEKAVVPKVDETVWQSDPKKRASYTAGDGTTTFRVPDYNGKSQGGSAAVVLRGDGLNADIVGVIQGDAIRNITGDVNPNFLASSFVDQDTLYGTGALRGRVGQKFNKYSYSLNGPYHGGALDFDASRQVPTAQENRMINTAGVWCIRLAHKAVQSGIITAQGVIDKVNSNSDKIRNLEDQIGFRKSTCLVNVVGTGAPHETVVAELPSNINKGTRYVLPNPFGNNTPVICWAELYISGKWADTGWVFVGQTGQGYGTRASYVQGEGVVVQTGAAAVVSTYSVESGGGHGSTTGTLASAPCRVFVRKLED